MTVLAAGGSNSITAAREATTPIPPMKQKTRPQGPGPSKGCHARRAYGPP